MTVPLTDLKLLYPVKAIMVIMISLVVRVRMRVMQQRMRVVYVLLRRVIILVVL